MSKKYAAESLNETHGTLSGIDPDGKSQKTLIICIDRDDDIGVKTGIKTPIVGRDACIDAATRLSLVDPEEADANAIFGAIKEYDNLLSKGEFCEIIVVSGLFERSVMGDKKIREQVAAVLQGYPASGAVIVSDGIEGAELAPVIQSLVPIISLKKIVIKHSRSVEETYAVLGRYLRMLIFDSRYSKYSLGIPGAIIIGALLVSAFAPISPALVFTVLVGIVLLIRGFDIDRRIESIGSLTPSGYLRLFSVIASVLIVLAGIANGVRIFFVSNCASGAPCSIALEVVAHPSEFILYAPKIIGYFISNSQFFVWLGIAVYIGGTIFFNFLRTGARHIPRSVDSQVVLLLLYFPVSIFAGTLVSNSNNSDFFVAIILFALAVNFSIAAYVYHVFSERRRESTDL
ncbi:MAG: DUF373 family protein, partial [Thaumarchaeota archaeon]|nr:DUF373 family protein [Nitrososphaerota archaeon]